MAKYELDISINGTKINDELGEISKGVARSRSELTTLKKELQASWDMDKFNRAQELAGKAVDGTKEKVRLLKAAMKEIEDTGMPAERTAEYERIKRELTYAEAAARKAAESLQEIQKIQFKGALDELDKSISDSAKEAKELEIALRASNGSWDKEKFEQAQKAAQNVIVQTNEKVELLKKRMQELNDSGITDENRREFDELRAEIVKTENEARKAEDALKDINNIKHDKVIEECKRLDDGLNKIGKTATVIAGAIAATGGALAKMGFDAIEAADEIATTADALGITTTALQRYRYIAMQSDVSDEALSKSIVKLNGDIGNLALGIEDNGNRALLKLIGTFENADGTIKNSEQVFYEAIEALSQMEDVATRTGLANAIFGERFAKDLNPMLNQGTQALEQYNAEFERIGYISEENIEKFSEIDNKINETKAMLSQMKNEAAVDLLPYFEEVIEYLKANKDEIGDTFKGLVTGIISVIKTVYEMRGAVAAAVAVCATLKAALAITSTIAAAQKAFGGVKTATDAATASQYAHNTAVAMSPVGALVTLLAAATAGLMAYSAATGTAAKSVDGLTSSYNRAKKEAEENLAKTEVEIARVRELIPQYESLNKKVRETGEGKSELERVVRDINKIMPNAISNARDAAGAYTTFGTAVYNATLELEKQAKYLAHQDLYMEARKNHDKILVESGWGSVENLKQVLDEAYEYGAVKGDGLVSDWLNMFIDVSPDGTLGAGFKGLEGGLSQAQNTLTALEELRRQMDEYKKLVENSDYIPPTTQQQEYSPPYIPPPATDYSANIADEVESQKRTAEEAQKERERLAALAIQSGKDQKEAEKRIREESIRQELSQIRWLYNSQEIELEEYIKQLEGYRDKYYSKSVLTIAEMDAKRNISLEVMRLKNDLEQQIKNDIRAQYNHHMNMAQFHLGMGNYDDADYLEAIRSARDGYLDETMEEWLSATLAIHEVEKRIAETEKRELQERAENFRRFTDEVSKLAAEEAEARIKAIDDEIAARDRLMESEKAQKKLEQAQARLLYETDEENSRQLQKEIARLKKEAQDREIKRLAEENKDLIRQEMKNAQEAMEEMAATYQRIMGATTNNDNSYYNSQSQSFSFGGQTFVTQGLTSAQLEDSIRRVFNELIRSI